MRALIVVVALVAAFGASGCCFNPLSCCPLNQLSLSPVSAPDRAKLDPPKAPASIVAVSTAQRY